MKLYTPLLVSFLCVMTALDAGRAEAQSPRTFAIDGTVGFGTWLSNGDYRGGHAGIHADAIVSARVASTDHHGIVVGAAFGIFGTGPVTSVCILRPDGSCQPAFPRIDWIGLLGGIEGELGTWRLLAGPVYARADFDEYGLGLGARADLAVPLPGPIAIVLSVRTALVPRIDGNFVGLGGLGVGLRIR